MHFRSKISWCRQSFFSVRIILLDPINKGVGSDVAKPVVGSGWQQMVVGPDAQWCRVFICIPCKKRVWKSVHWVCKCSTVVSNI